MTTHRKRRTKAQIEHDRAAEQRRADDLADSQASPTWDQWLAASRKREREKMA